MYHALLTLTVPAAAEIQGGRFVTLTGTYPVAGKTALGIARTDADTSDLIAVDVLGAAQVTAATDIQQGDAIASDAEGRAVVAVSPAVVVARALDSAKSGQPVPVLLIPN